MGCSMDYSRQLHNYKPSPFMAKGSRYVETFADASVFFINNLKHTKDPWFGMPFELIDWQERIIRDVFGILRNDNIRQFRTCYVEVPKKQGKSELAAAIALLLTVCDGEFGAEVYGCAVDRMQAGNVFDVAVHMVDLCPEIKPFFKYHQPSKKLIFKPLNSFYQALSGEVSNKHGINAHGIIFDELHAVMNREYFDVMTKGSGDTRRQPLTFIITTAGYDRNSVCWEQHQKAEDILRGNKIDPTFYPVIYSAGEEDDWRDPEVWKKCNPSLGITVRMDRMKAACEDAIANPANENTFRQLRLCQWTRQATRWMPLEKWMACNFPVDPEALKGRDCYGGLDLSATTDMTAFVLVFPPIKGEDKYQILSFFWIPADRMKERSRRDHVPYEGWFNEGLINATEGDVIDYAFIESTIIDLGEKYNIKQIAFDSWNAWQIVQNLQSAGFEMEIFDQRMKSISTPTKELMRLTLLKKLAHGGHKVLQWNIDNIMVIKDANENIRPDKSKSTERIDGAIALIMALDKAQRGANKKKSDFQEKGMLILDVNHPRGWYRTGELDNNNNNDNNDEDDEI